MAGNESSYRYARHTVRMLKAWEAERARGPANA